MTTSLALVSKYTTPLSDMSVCPTMALAKRRGKKKPPQDIAAAAGMFEQTGAANDKDLVRALQQSDEAQGSG